MKVFAGAVLLVIAAVLGPWGMAVEASPPPPNPVLSQPVTQVQVTTLSSGANPEDIVAVAECPEGTQVTGGGFNTSDVRNAPIRFSAKSGNGWKVIGRALSPVVHSATAFAMCASLQ